MLMNVTMVIGLMEMGALRSVKLNLISLVPRIMLMEYTNPVAHQKSLKQHWFQLL